jgi:hypothetical protein
MKWEYLLVRWTTSRNGPPIVFEVDGDAVEPTPLLHLLSDLGGQGWELAGVGDDAGHTLFLKRPIP